MFEAKRCATMLPASDVERAKSWYADHLDLKPTTEDPTGVQYKTGDGTEFWIYPSQYAGTNQATAMGFLAKDLSTEMDDLKSRGVTFEEYDIPGVKTVEGIADFGNGERGAWFKDSEGNIIALFESPRYQ
ncbi:MAG TPA: VOC family protein [Actinomycetota bacterium]|jgi:predicted enzyme related to lactoylglutathione lyase